MALFLAIRLSHLEAEWEYSQLCIREWCSAKEGHKQAEYYRHFLIRNKIECEIYDFNESIHEVGAIV